MANIKKIASKILIFVLDILLFSFSILKQVVLPARRKKGNLLFSLFIFFVGIIERLDNLEYGVFHMANLLRRKYIRQSLLIVGSVLFLLSSLEWTGEKILNSTSQNYIERPSSVRLVKETFCEQGYINEHTQEIFSGNDFPAYKNILYSYTPSSASIKDYLLFRSIRI